MEDESLELQHGIDYSEVVGLSSEEKERLARVRPRSLVRHKFCTMNFYADYWLPTLSDHSMR